LVIGVAGSLFPGELLNDEGVNREVAKQGMEDLLHSVVPAP